MKPVATACGLALFLAVAGCSSEAVPGEPGSQFPSSHPATPTSPTAPSVANPLSTDKVQNNMCAGLTSAQLGAYLGAIDTPRPDKSPKGLPLCTWLSSDGQSPGITLYVDPGARGVGDLYERRLGDNFFEKGDPVAGYPAIHTSAAPDGPKRGDCMTTVAVSDQVTVTVYANTITKTYQYYSSMCTVSDKLAEAAVENLKAGG